MIDIPLLHGLTLKDLINIIGNQVVYINSLEFQLQQARQENERLKKELADGRLDTSDTN